MSIQEKLRNPFMQQYLLEILLPIVGYFLFGWTLPIIAVFYLVDQLAAEFSFVRKFRAIKRQTNGMSSLFIIIALLLFGLVLYVEWLAIFDFFCRPERLGTDAFLKEITTFAKEELWLLAPLVIFMYYLKDQFTFFMPRRFLQKNAMPFFYWHLVHNVLIALGIMLLFAGLKQMVVHDIVLIVIFLSLKLMHDFTIGRWIEKRSEKPQTTN